MKQVVVKLYATLRKYAPPEAQQTGKAFHVELADNARLRTLLATLKIPDQETKLVFVNGQKGTPGQLLHDGDDVAVFPPIAGGS